jgi:integrase
MYKSSSRYPVGSGITVYLRHQTWWADIRRDGIRAQRNLRTHDQKEAVRRALDIGLGTTTIRAVRWQEAFDRYLSEHSPLYHAPQSKAKAVCILGEFARFMEQGGPEGSLALDAVTRTRIEDWLRDLAPRLSPCTCNCKLRTLRAFLRWTVGKGWLPADPSAGIRRLRETKNDDKELTADEIGRLLKAADKLEDTLILDIFRLALNTGARPGELVNLRVKDADLTGGVLFIRNHPTHRLKDRADRRVKMNDVALEVLRRRRLAAGPDLEGLLFPSTKGTVLNLSNLAHRFKQVARKADVPRATLYHARHTFASFAAVYLPQFVLQEIMGHSDPALTARHYIHAAAAKAPPPPVIGGTAASG